MALNQNYTIDYKQPIQKSNTNELNPSYELLNEIYNT